MMTLPKAALLRKSWQYKKVYDQGRRLRGQDFSLIFLPNGAGECRLGISIHGARTAVRRNRIKRLIREFFRLDRGLLSPSADVIFAVRPGFSLNSLREVNEAVRLLLAGGAEKKSSAARAKGASPLLPEPEPDGRAPGKGVS